MDEFDDCLPNRKFDNFQFVDYHAVTSKVKHPDANFALHALMEIPLQYKTIRKLGYISEFTNGSVISKKESDVNCDTKPMGMISKRVFPRSRKDMRH